MMTPEELDGVVYEGLQRLTARWSGQVECDFDHGSEWLLIGRGCPVCGAVV